MEQLREIDRYFKDDFMICDARPSHMQILFRNSKFVRGVNVNTELLFKGVEYLEVPSTIEGFQITTNGSKDDLEYIGTKLPEVVPAISRNFYSIFKITCNGINYYIVAIFLQIQTNTLGALDRSLWPLENDL